MDIYVYNKNFEKIGTPVDFYTSTILCTRFIECGDFEIYIEATKKTVELLAIDNFISKQDSEIMYLIEAVEMEKDEEKGAFLSVKGRCLKALLARRIIWNQTNLDGTVEDCIRQLVTENAISPSDISRKIPLLTLGERHGWTETMQMQVTGDNLLEKTIEICTSYNYGFDILFRNNQLVFELCKGVDRSKGQEVNQRVIFNENYDNLLTSQYSFNSTGFANVALVHGEGEGTRTKTNSYGSSEGLERREIYVDGSNISTNSGGINAEKYLVLLAEKGKEALAEAINEESVSADVLIDGVFKYGRDFALGDIVTIETSYGLEKDTRIMEVTESYNESGKYEVEIRLNL